jgi:hypothetical protein
MNRWGLSEEGVIMSAEKNPHPADPLDDALKQTFPASDAVAIIMPRRRQRQQQELRDDDHGDGRLARQRAAPKRASR